MVYEKKVAIQITFSISRMLSTKQHIPYSLLGISKSVFHNYKYLIHILNKKWQDILKFQFVSFYRYCNQHIWYKTAFHLHKDGKYCNKWCMCTRGGNIFFFIFSPLFWQNMQNFINISIHFVHGLLPFIIPMMPGN